MGFRPGTEGGNDLPSKVAKFIRTQLAESRPEAAARTAPWAANIQTMQEKKLPVES